MTRLPLPKFTLPKFNRGKLTAGKIILFFLIALIAVLPVANASLTDDPFDSAFSVIRARILASGAPEESLNRILHYIKQNKGETVRQEIYTCKDQDESNTKPCDEPLRRPSHKEIKIKDPRHVVIVDFSLPSTEKRMFFIDLITGDVRKFLVTHGRGSGENKIAYKFSNIKNSNQSSLGLYQTGEVYTGEHGEMIRLYGLESSNDQAYNRDIVIHSADYAKPEFINKINPLTKRPYGRLGLSWGCPAVSPETMASILPILKSGVIYDLYQPDLMEAARSGKEVVTDRHIEESQTALLGW
jgi:L,D-transpeptidase catalytic domain